MTYVQTASAAKRKDAPVAAALAAIRASGGLEREAVIENNYFIIFVVRGCLCSMHLSCKSTVQLVRTSLEWECISHTKVGKEYIFTVLF